MNATELDPSSVEANNIEESMVSLHTLSTIYRPVHEC